MTLKPRIFANYDEGLLLCYEEEISGESYFGKLADFHTGRAKQALQLLSEMEAVTAKALLPLVERRGLRTAERADLLAEGEIEAAKLRGMPWNNLISSWERDFPAFVVEMKQVADLAPAEDEVGLLVLLDHEVAAIAFAERETSAHPESLQPLTEFLARHDSR
ncbi:MAG: hypothetical protein ACKVP5_08545 [Aestuariivirga sp.]